LDLHAGLVRRHGDDDFICCVVREHALTEDDAKRTRSRGSAVTVTVFDSPGWSSTRSKPSSRMRCVLARFDGMAQQWRIAGGSYEIALSKAADATVFDC
jgi:hypothetical protein